MSLFSATECFLVTGASSGIGRAIALRLHEEGATVIANGRDTQRLEEICNILQFSNRIHVVQRDLLDSMDGLTGWLKDICKHYGPLSGLVCAAGITWNSPMRFYPLDKAHLIFDICCHVPLLLGSAFCQKHNNIGNGASIVYIAAAASVQPNPGQGIYGAAKAALVAGARCQAMEFAKIGLRVNCISPGLVETPMFDNTVKLLGQTFVDHEKALYPLGFGKPSDVADLATFLLSQRARWLTGQNIVLSGGR